MNAKPSLTLWSSRCSTVLGFAVVAAIASVSIATYADPSAVTATASRVADVSLADLNLSTPEGMSAARARLQAMAQRVCAEHTSSSQPNFTTCVDSTLAGALRQIDALKLINATSSHSVTRAANVSLADLDLSTLEGSRAAHERLVSMAQRVCTELARNHELTYQ